MSAFVSVDDLARALQKMALAWRRGQQSPERASIAETFTNEQLAARVVAGERAAWPQLWKQIVRFVRVYLTSRCAVQAYELEDAEQDAAMVIHEKLPRFDPTKGNLLTWAASWIRASSRYSYDRRGDVRVPAHANDKLLDLTKRPRDEEVLPKKVRKTVDLARAARRQKSLDAPIGTDGDGQLTLLDTLASGASPEEMVIREHERARAADLVSSFRATLCPRDCAVFDGRLACDGEEQLTLVEIGDRFGVSRERIRQIEATLKERLRAHARCTSLGVNEISSDGIDG